MSQRYEVSVQTTFAASHQLRGYKADLEPLHGHNFRVEVFVGAESLDDSGLIIDFLELEAKLREVVAPYDHRHLNDIAPFDEENPTTENIARFFYETLAKSLPRGVVLHRVRVWEAPTYSATYGEL
ncbi:MAG TPA: 6-carboxytetrahydropterin synthase QueD [Vicinamibacteria bacterium]|nr:6-carboxytetrahydropterin synthase QueD [Vicinamibacteria bacterium]